ncbi:hypothetical protein OEZ85_005903 [Tetradesmus obliquus]|uniref:Uncharacterized protein n=1 Tax=Tetradesmus obliquus TaxID=3088 RepID=A0ABY8UEV9_TETOB|nr:hypothetical protein OEZ85_005903 [Tetradesmus obliquus]
MDLSSSSVSENSSGSQQLLDGGLPSLSVSLSIQPSSLEQRYWNRRCQSRLLSLDSMFELCNAVMWLAILPSLGGSERLIGKTRLLVAAAQLALMHVAPQLWLQHRSAILTACQVLHCSMLMPWQVLGESGISPAGLISSWEYSAGQNSSSSAAAAAAAYAAQQQIVPGRDAPFSTIMMLASGFWSHLLFVLFHQQPFTIQAPLLALSTLVQGFYVASSPLQQSGLEALSSALNWGFEQLLLGFFGNMSPALDVWRTVLPQDTAVLTTVLFLHTFGSFLLPVFLAYIIEWKLKVSFLLCECSTQSEQLRVLTPAAAVVRGSFILSGMLYTGWLLLMAIASWVVCSTVATVLSSPLAA